LSVTCRISETHYLQTEDLPYLLCLEHVSLITWHRYVKKNILIKSFLQTYLNADNVFQHERNLTWRYRVHSAVLINAILQ